MVRRPSVCCVRDFKQVDIFTDYLLDRSYSEGVVTLKLMRPGAGNIVYSS